MTVRGGSEASPSATPTLARNFLCSAWTGSGGSGDPGGAAAAGSGGEPLRCARVDSWDCGDAAPAVVAPHCRSPPQISPWAPRRRLWRNCLLRGSRSGLPGRCRAGTAHSRCGVAWGSAPGSCAQSAARRKLQDGEWLG